MKRFVNIENSEREEPKASSYHSMLQINYLKYIKEE